MNKNKKFSNYELPFTSYHLPEAGFTLMELMVVIAIIVLLAGIMTPNVARRLERAKMTRAEADIAAIENAIAMYENDLGSYPPSYNLNGIDYLETCLTGRDSAGAYKPADNSKWSGPYIKGIDKDPWGKDYVYLKNKSPRNELLQAANIDYPIPSYGGSVNAPRNLSYYIYSTGKNKSTASVSPNDYDDDVNNWDVKTSWREEY